MNPITFDLKKVRAVAAQKNTEHVITVTRATNFVVRIYGIDTEAAKTFILNQISALEEKNFSDAVLIHGSPYDVYGKRIDGIPWYIKFSILTDEDGEFISNLSFHPTEFELKTRCEVLECYVEA